MSTLTIVAAAGSAPTSIALTVPSPIVTAQSGERFVVRSVREAAPTANVVLTDDELTENLRTGLFVETPRWTYRPDHALLFLRADLHEQLVHLRAVPECREKTTRDDGVCVFYASLEQIATFRRDAADKLLRGARERLSRGRLALDNAELTELQEWLPWASVVAARGSSHEEDAAVLWLVVQMDYNPGRVSSARDAALRVRGMSPAKLDELVRRCRAERGVVSVPVSSSVARVEAEVLSVLDRHPYVVARLASCGLGEVPTAITRALFSLRATELARTFNHALLALDEDSTASPDDRRALDEIFRACMRYAIDWRDAVRRGRDAVLRGVNAIELPLRMATLAELVLSAIDDRAPAFGRREHGSLVGAQQVSLPAVLRAPIPMTATRFVEAMVQHLAETVFTDLVEARRRPGSRAAIADVEGTLRARGYERPGEARPFYLVFDQEVDHLWRVACDAQRSEAGLPSLRLVRLVGEASADESASAAHVTAVLDRLTSS